MVYRDPDCQDDGDIHTGTRVCKRCLIRKPMADFHWANAQLHRRRKCKACVDQMRVELQAADPERYSAMQRWATIRRKYGLTKADFDAMLTAQGGRCAICRDELVTTHIDHDHGTGRVRGLLCFTCNTALGKFRDDPELLRAAIRYLDDATSHDQETAA